MTFKLTFAAALALAATAPAYAQGPPAAAQDTPAVRRSAADLKQAFFALQDEFDDATTAYREEANAAAQKLPSRIANKRRVRPW